MRKTRTRRLASFIIAVGIISVMFLGEVAAYSYSFYCNWSVYYTGTTTGSHLSETHTPPVHDYYRISATSSKGDGRTKVSFNGVDHYLEGGGAFFTVHYYGTTNPSINFQLQDFTSGYLSSASGEIKVADD